MSHKESTTGIPADKVADVVAGYLANKPPPLFPPQRAQEEGKPTWIVTATFPDDGPDTSTPHS